MKTPMLVSHISEPCELTIDLLFHISDLSFSSIIFQYMSHSLICISRSIS